MAGGNLPGLLPGRLRRCAIDRAQDLDTGFPGGTYQQIFYVADVQASGPRSTANCTWISTRRISSRYFPWPATGRARLIGTVRDERAEHAETLQFEDVSRRAIEHMKVKIQQVNWFSTYRVHHRVAEHFAPGAPFCSAMPPMSTAPPVAKA